MTKTHLDGILKNQILKKFTNEEKQKLEVRKSYFNLKIACKKPLKSCPTFFHGFKITIDPEILPEDHNSSRSIFMLKIALFGRRANNISGSTLIQKGLS